jgi:hypothetical protein
MTSFKMTGVFICIYDSFLYNLLDIYLCVVYLNY